MKTIGFIVVLVSLVAAFFITSAIVTSWSTPGAPPPEKGVPPPIIDLHVHGSVFGEIFAFAIVIIIVFMIAWWVYREHKDKEDKWGQIVRNNATMTFLGLIVLNAIAYILHYEGWRKFYGTGTLFWMTNIGIVLFVYLVFENSKAAKVVAVVLALLVLSALLGNKSIFDPPKYTLSKTSTTNLSHGVPTDIALRIIADCESGGGVPGAAHQFEADGKTLLKNKEGSSAIGKYQILASDHEERAKKMGFDIRTEAGNEGYAKALYAESGTKHWRADARSVTCWEPKLRAYIWGGGSEIDMVVIAPTDDWSRVIPLPRNGGNHSLDGFGKKYTVRWNNGRKDQVDEDLPRPEGVQKKKPAIVYDFQLKSRESELVPITVKFF